MSSFTNALHARLEAAEAARAERRRANVALMEDRNRRTASLETAAERIHREVIRPMVEEMAGVFGNGTVEHYRTPAGFTSRCMFTRTDRYPASAELAIAVGPGPVGEGAALTYHLGIVPELMSFTKSDSWVFDPENVDRDEVRTRLADWLLRFTDTYLRLESEPGYQDWPMHVDPVCGMRISGTVAAAVSDHERRKIYFCSEACRQRFEAQPGLYLAGVAPMP